MSTGTSRIGLAIRRGLTRGDSWVAIVALFLGGMAAGDGRWLLAVLGAVIGVVFLTASGDYAWRKGFVAGKREIKG